MDNTLYNAINTSITEPTHKLNIPVAQYAHYSANDTLHIDCHYLFPVAPADCEFHWYALMDAYRNPNEDPPTTD